MIQYILATIKHLDLEQKMGIVSTAIMGTVSMSVLNAYLQATFFIVSIILAIVTILHTQEKRKELKSHHHDIDNDD